MTLMMEKFIKATVATSLIRLRHRVLATSELEVVDAAGLLN